MFEKIKNVANTPFTIVHAKKIWPFIKPYWKMALLGVLITVPVGALDAVIAWALKPYMDVVLIEKSARSASYIPILIILFSLLQGVLTYLAKYVNAWVGQKITNDLKKKLYIKLVHNDVEFFDNAKSGEVLVRFSGDADTACAGLVSNVKGFTTRFFSSVALVGVLFYNSWQLAIIGVVFLLAAFFPLSKVRKRIRKATKQTVTSASSMSTKYNEAYSGNRVVSSYNLYKYQYDRFKENLAEMFRLQMKIVKRTGLVSPLMHVLIAVGIAIVVWYGSYLIVTGVITPGNFVSFIAALLMLYTPIKAIGNTYTSLQGSLLAMERVFEVLETNPLITSPENPVFIDKFRKAIEYKNVSFAYKNGKTVLKNINASIKIGQTVALVGATGGGKTTFVNLLPRFYDVTKGEILIDGVDVRDMDITSLRNHIAVVFQDNFLFSGTIRDNIIMGKLDATEEEINRAVDNACLREFVDSLPDGLDTDIGERGILLSGGQKQRIGIARAFIKNAPIVILDEATSALDNQSEAIVQKALDNLMVDRTVFVIAHRLSTIHDADKIIVINKGQIVEEGTHKTLIAKKGAYYKLYHAKEKL